MFSLYWSNICHTRIKAWNTFGPSFNVYFIINFLSVSLYLKCKQFNIYFRSSRGTLCEKVNLIFFKFWIGMTQKWTKFFVICHLFLAYEKLRWGWRRIRRGQMVRWLILTKWPSNPLNNPFHKKILYVVKTTKTTGDFFIKYIYVYKYT